MQLIWVCPTVAMGNRALNLPIIKPDSHLQQGMAPRWEPVSRELWSAERNCQAININRANRAGERHSDQNALEGKALHWVQTWWVSMLQHFKVVLHRNPQLPVWSRCKEARFLLLLIMLFVERRDEQASPPGSFTLPACLLILFSSVPFSPLLLHFMHAPSTFLWFLLFSPQISLYFPEQFLFILIWYDDPSLSFNLFNFSFLQDVSSNCDVFFFCLPSFFLLNNPSSPLPSSLSGPSLVDISPSFCDPGSDRRSVYYHWDSSSC